MLKKRNHDILGLDIQSCFSNSSTYTTSFTFREIYISFCVVSSTKNLDINNIKAKCLETRRRIELSLPDKETELISERSFPVAQSDRHYSISL